jgi:hypothetical protein
MSKYMHGVLLTGMGSLLLAGCAGSPPQPKFTHDMVSGSRIAATDTADVRIEAAEHITVNPYERDRVAQKIKARIDERKLKNPAAPAARQMEVLLYVTRYEKGNAFARAMLAGLGQIHLDGKISVYQMPEHTLLEEFDMQKTFAWGGVYGASTSMEQIEDTFADGVAATVTGQQQPTPQPPATAQSGAGTKPAHTGSK